MYKLLIFLLIFFFSFGFASTFLLERLPEHTDFAKGTFPADMPNGDYKGSILYSGPWQGQSFDSKSSTGANLVLSNNKTVKMFNFKTVKSKDIADTKKNVLKLDYNSIANPFWVRFVENELVQTDGDEYMGKIYIKLIPSHPFVAGYYTLRK